MKSQKLGARETEEQGLAGILAPSLKRENSEKDQKPGARETEEQGLAGILAPSPGPRSGAPSEPGAGNPPLGASSGPEHLVSRNERSRCTKCTAASSICYAFLGLQVQRRSPHRPAAPHQVRQRPARAAKPSPFRRSLLIGSAHVPPSRAYIGRLGMCTVKVVPLPGTLSTCTVAWWIISACFTMERPSPVPPTSLERLLSTR